MPTTDSTRITLVGGGLGGSLLAVYLGQAGHEVDLYERRSDPASGNIVGGRSINLAISVRGIHALEEVGLAEPIMKLAIPMRGRMIHAPDGSLHYQPYDKDPARHINSVSRAGLNGALIDAARTSPNVRVHFDCKCVDVDLDAPSAEFVRTSAAAFLASAAPGSLSPGSPAPGSISLGSASPGSARSAPGETFRTSGGVVIGVDGAFSAVRRAMQRLDRFSFSQEYLTHGYKELTIPPDANGRHRMEPNALHIWPRKSFMMIALPNPDGSFTCTLFLQHDPSGVGPPWPRNGSVGPPRPRNSGVASSFAELHSRDDVARFFETYFRDAIPHMPTLLDDFERNPVGSMATVRCFPWSHGGKVTLVGDAAHAVVPFYGQGMNASFEDCSVLHDCIRRLAPDWPRTFDEYQRRRKLHVDTLADLAIGNFIEMRDLTGSRAFRAKKTLERTLHRALPAWFTPLYTLVSFTNTPYADAVRRARHQYAVIAIFAVTIAVLALALVGRFVLHSRAVEAISVAVVAVSAAFQIVRSKIARVRNQARQAGARGRG